ncbi:MAG: hypothetical protein EBX41_10265, partial [Chitinophagia bacterium]|nr:hypothetical protein [Chitinophagia bacterium]
MLCFSHLIHAQHLPQTTITDLSTGKKVAFNSTVEQGKVTLISFWATWCIPCKNEIRNIVKVMDTWKQSADFNYITVSIDETRAQGLARSYAINQG